MFPFFFTMACFAQLHWVQAQKPPRLEGLAITEVLLQASPGWGSYVELLNRNPLSGKTINLSGYQLRTGTQRAYLIPTGTRLAPGEFLVIDFSTGKTALRIPKGSGAKVLIAGFKAGFFALHKPGQAGYLGLLDPKGRFVDGLVWNETPFPEAMPAGITEAVEQGLWSSNRAIALGKSRDGSLGLRRIDPFSWNKHEPSDWEFCEVADQMSPGSPFPWIGNEHEVRIRVTDPKGAPLSGVSIEIPSMRKKVWTDGKGIAEISGFGKGSWNFHLIKPGFVERWVSLIRKPAYRRANLHVVLVSEEGHIQGNWEVGPEGGVFKDWTGRLEMRFPKGFVKTKTKIHAIWVDKVYSQWKERGLYDLYMGRGKGVDYAVPLGTLVVKPDLIGQGKVEVTLRAPLMQFRWEGAREIWRTRKDAVVEQIEGDGTTPPRQKASVSLSQNEITLRFATSRFSSFVLGQEEKSKRTVAEIQSFLRGKPDRWRVTSGRISGEETTDPEGDGHATDPWRRLHDLCGSTVESEVSMTFSVGISQTDESGWEIKGGVKAKLKAAIPFLVSGETEVGAEGGKHGIRASATSEELTIHFKDSIKHSSHFRPCRDKVRFYLVWELTTLYIGKYDSKTKKYEIKRLKVWIPKGIQDIHQSTKECCFPGEDGKKKCDCKEVPPKKSH
jgi:hypothetical protein